MKNRYLLIIQSLIICFVWSACDNSKHIANNSKADILWYKQPAVEWEDALPLGNGKLGIMVFGGTSNERIQLNDDSMWPNDLGWDNPEANKEDLQKIRKLLFEGKNVEADAFFVDKFSRKGIVRSHQTLGDLFIDFDHKNITDYRRALRVCLKI